MLKKPVGPAPFKQPDWAKNAAFVSFHRLVQSANGLIRETNFLDSAANFTYNIGIKVKKTYRTLIQVSSVWHL